MGKDGRAVPQRAGRVLGTGLALAAAAAAQRRQGPGARDVRIGGGIPLAGADGRGSRLGARPATAT
eukprot:2078415-Alexandrium_andersonii.AAC.1